MATRNAARAKTARPTRRTPPSRSGWSGWPLVGVAAIVAVLVAVIVVVQRGRGGPAGDGTAAYVGGDLHAAAAFDGRLFVSGHDGAAYSDAAGAWTQIGSLQGKDGRGWATVPGAVLLGVGMGGAAESRDGGATRQQLAVPDGTAVVVVETSGALIAAVHTGDKAEMSRSTDGGRNWTRI